MAPSPFPRRHDDRDAALPTGNALRVETARRAAAMTTHTGGCHCGRVRFEVDAPARFEVTDCDCSICSKSGYLHLIVPKRRFKLISGADVLTTYEFNTKTAKHLFCSVCGIKSFYVPRSHPDGYSVNARCLDDGTVEQMTIVKSDGKNWEKTHSSGTRPTLE
jgi:hypothetical protein